MVHIYSPDRAVAWFSEPCSPEPVRAHHGECVFFMASIWGCDTTIGILSSSVGVLPCLKRRWPGFDPGKVHFFHFPQIFVHFVRKRKFHFFFESRFFWKSRNQQKYTKTANKKAWLEEKKIAGKNRKTSFSKNAQKSRKKKYLIIFGLAVISRELIFK